MGAKIMGKETMIDTSDAGTCNSTIITRFRVPTRSTRAMPTDTWNRDSLSNLPSGNSAEAASAKGKKRGPKFAQVLIIF
jgi:hypothetical protein